MSCSIVSDIHISVLVAGLFEYEVAAATDDPRAVGTSLLEENKTSYRTKYAHRLDEPGEDEALARPFTLTTTESPLHPVALLKAIRYYQYHSCEHDGWTDSTASTITDRLIGAVCTRYPVLGGQVWDRVHRCTVPAHLTHPVYDLAPWCVTEIEEVLADRFPAVSR